MKKITVYIDCDGVILNTVKKARELAQKEGYLPYDFDSMHGFYVGADWNVLIYESGILDNAISKIKQIIATGKYDVKILTKLSGSDTEELSKKRLFAKLLPGVEVITLAIDEHKDEVVDPVGQILIEDDLRNAKRWRDANGICVVLDLEQIDYEHDIVNNLIDFEKAESVKKLNKVM